jgi:hypothetical protein
MNYAEVSVASDSEEHEQEYLHSNESPEGTPHAASFGIAGQTQQEVNH